MTSFPKTGVSWVQLKEQMMAMRKNDVDWRNGRASLLVYYAGEEVLSVAREAYAMFMNENALSPAAFPSLDRMEREILGAAACLLHGPATTTGRITSGGTESIILALKAARDRAIIRAGGAASGRFEIIVPTSAHPAFDKAAELLGMDVRRIAVGPDFRADPKAMEAAISVRTIMLAASAPSLPFGIIDPIDDVAAVALRHDLWLHVDACIGGYIAPFAAMLGYPVPRFDFLVPGVMSISADLHKYGYAAKGASTLLFRTAYEGNGNAFEFFAWPKGRYCTPTLLGTRSGGAVAAAWAVMHFLGEAGYLKLTERVMRLRDRYVAGIRQIEDLQLIAPPDLAVISYTARALDIMAVGDQLGERGWYVSRLASPAGLHKIINLVHEPIVDNYLGDLSAAVRAVKSRSLVARTHEVSTY